MDACCDKRSINGSPSFMKIEILTNEVRGAGSGCCRVEKCSDGQQGAHDVMERVIHGSVWVLINVCVNEVLPPAVRVDFVPMDCCSSS